MGETTYGRIPASKKRLSAGYVFGAPVKDLGWLTCLIMGVATGMAAFFIATFVAIVSLLVWNAAGHRADFAISYRLVGLPVGVVVMATALAYLGTFWVKRITRRA